MSVTIICQSMYTHASYVRLASLHTHTYIYSYTNLTHVRLAVLHTNDEVKSRAHAIESKLASRLQISGMLPHVPGIPTGTRNRDAEMLKGSLEGTPGALRRGLLLCEFEQMVGQQADADGKIQEVGCVCLYVSVHIYTYVCMYDCKHSETCQVLFLFVKLFLTILMIFDRRVTGQIWKARPFTTSSMLRT
jgi:hypothetical protein